MLTSTRRQGEPQFVCSSSSPSPTQVEPVLIGPFAPISWVPGADDCHPLGYLISAIKPVRGQGKTARPRERSGFSLKENCGMDSAEHLGCAASPPRTADGSAADWGPAGPRDSNLDRRPRRIAGPLGRKWRGSWLARWQAGQGFALGRKCAGGTTARRPPWAPCRGNDLTSPGSTPWIFARAGSSKVSLL